MISNVENTVEWLRLNGLKYFVVSTKDADNNRVFESDDGKTFDDNVSLFRRVMEVSQGSRYLIKASDTKEAKRGKFFEEFKNMPGAENMSSNAQTPNINGIYGKDDIDAIVEKRIQDYETKQELIRLRKENAELEKEANRKLSISEQFMERAMPYVGTLGTFLLNKVIPNPAQIALAGFDNTNTVETTETNEVETMEELNLTDEQTERVERALQKFGKADPDFILLLEKIADMAHNKDAMYAIAKNMLLTK